MTTPTHTHTHEPGWCAYGAGPCQHETDCPHTDHRRPCPEWCSRKRAHSHGAAGSLDWYNVPARA